MNVEPIFLKKCDLCIIESWSKDIHGSSQDPQFDKFLSTRKINYTSFNDEYDINSRNNLFDFIDNWSYMIGLGEVYFTGASPYIAIADTYIYRDYCLCVDKTYLIIKLQRIWKEYYKKLQTKIKIAKKPHSIMYREIYGRIPNK